MAAITGEQPDDFSCCKNMAIVELSTNRNVQKPFPEANAFRPNSSQTHG
jgi:hypothetical protein